MSHHATPYAPCKTKIAPGRYETRCEHDDEVYEVRRCGREDWVVVDSRECVHAMETTMGDCLEEVADGLALRTDLPLIEGKYEHCRLA